MQPAVGPPSAHRADAYTTGLVLTVALAVVLASCARAPRDVANARHSPRPSAQLERAVEFLVAVHPDPFRYIGEAELRSALRREMRALDARGQPDRYAIAAAAQRLVARLGDAHVLVGLDGPTEGVSLVPLLPKIAGDKVFVDASIPSMELGTELLEIEGRDAMEFLAELADLSSVDGARADVRLRQAERRFTFLASMLLGDEPHYRAKVRSPDGRETFVQLQGADPTAIQQLSSTRHSAPYWGGGGAGGAWPSARRLDGDTLVLRLPSFGVPDIGGFRERIDGIFAGLTGKEQLILDVRGNSGGVRQHGVAVLRHLLDEPFSQWRRVETRVRSIPEEFASNVTYPFAPKEALTRFPGDKVGDRWRVEGDPLAADMSAADRVHGGKITVLVDDATNSAAVEMVVSLLAHRSGVSVIGTPTQGECGRHTGQMPVVYGIEGSGVSIVVSLFEITLVPVSGCNAGQGIPLSSRVQYTEAHFLEARDPFLEALDQLD